MERRSVVKLDVVKRVRDYLGQPDEPGLQVLEENQLHRPKQQPTEANSQPDLPHMLKEIGIARVEPEDPEQRWVQPQHGRR
jgi:hypothetical protein